jgi:hypothetical protein
MKNIEKPKYRLVLDTKEKTDVPRLIILFHICEEFYETYINSGFPYAARMGSYDRKVSEIIDIRNIDLEPKWAESKIFEVLSLDRPLVRIRNSDPVEENVGTVFFSK